MTQPDDSLTQSKEHSVENRSETTRLLLKRYDAEIDLYKFYIDISIKGSLFGFGLTGALLSFFFTNLKDNSILVWSLPLPIILNAGFLVLAFRSIRASTKMMTDHIKTCQQLDNLEPFDTNPLPALCKILSCMYGLVTLGLLLLFCIHVFQLKIPG